MSDRTKGERALDDQNRLLDLLNEAHKIMRERQNRGVSASSSALRRLITGEQKRRDLIRRELNQKRGKP